MHDHGNCERCNWIDDVNAVLLKALYVAQEAMRAPLDDWKGVLERKALDAARAAIAQANGEGT